MKSLHMDSETQLPMIAEKKAKRKMLCFKHTLSEI